MADSGLLGSFSFGGTVYDSDDCLQSHSINRSIQTAQYQCGGATKTAAGAKVYVFNASLALAKGDTAVVAALAESSTGAFEYHPGGDAAGNIEMTSTRGIVTTANINGPVNGILTLDVSINLDNLTDATAV